MFRSAFLVLCAFRFVALLRFPIADCDETFNFLEPIHLLLYGGGLQTWEYSPSFALRSWLFSLLYAIPVLPFVHAGVPPLYVFYLLRFVALVFSALCDAVFVSALHRHVGSTAARFATLFMAVSPGLLTASIGVLPSSFAAACMSLCYAGALRRDGMRQVVLAAGLAATVGWPFAGLCAVPTALRFMGARMVVFAALAAVALLAAVGLVDSLVYNVPPRAVVSTLEIIRYNVLEAGRHGGSELYGVEPPTWYLKNLMLNFPVTFAAALAAPFVVAFCSVALRPSAAASISPGAAIFAREVNSARWRRLVSFLLPTYGSLALWLAFMSAQPHKEERFMAPAYTAIAAAGAVTFASLWHAAEAVGKPSGGDGGNVAAVRAAARLGGDAIGCGGCGRGDGGCARDCGRGRGRGEEPAVAVADAAKGKGKGKAAAKAKAKATAGPAGAGDATTSPAAAAAGARVRRPTLLTYALRLVVVAAVAIAVGASLCRAATLASGYGGHLGAWRALALSDEAAALAQRAAREAASALRDTAGERRLPRRVSVCVGREWHRFGSSFFLHATPQPAWGPAAAAAADAIRPPTTAASSNSDSGSDSVPVRFPAAAAAARPAVAAAAATFPFVDRIVADGTGNGGGGGSAGLRESSSTTAASAAVWPRRFVGDVAVAAAASAAYVDAAARGARQGVLHGLQATAHALLAAVSAAPAAAPCGSSSSSSSSSGGGGGGAAGGGAAGGCHETSFTASGGGGGGGGHADALALEVLFVRDGFYGQLPRPYWPPTLPLALAGTHGGFNAFNKDEPSRYATLSECDFLVDAEFPAEADGSAQPETFANETAAAAAAAERRVDVATLRADVASAAAVREARRTWRVVGAAPFLDAGATRSFIRRAFLAWLGGGGGAVYGSYNVYISPAADAAYRGGR